MTRISSSVGIITGIPIEETVTKLMALASRPKDLLITRNKGFESHQSALDTLGSRLLAFQFAANKLKSSAVFTTREVVSSKPDVLAAALPASGTPAVGSFQVRPVQVASSQQLLSQRFDASTTSLGSGSFTFGFGGFLDKGIGLDQLNAGAGVPRGKIRITDRSGAAATIDLSFARTVDDVLAAINSSADIAVTAATDGDSFTLADASGGVGNLIVSEVAGGTTAAGLGLAGISVASSTATGADVFLLYSGAKLATLNDGNGVQISKQGVVDLDVDLMDGTSLAIDLFNAGTLGDVLTQINAANPAKLSAAISGDGNRIVLTDLSGGAGTFSVGNGVTGTTAADLGIAATAVGATLSGTRLVSGLKDTLLASLNGGAGLGTLGQITLTDRDGVSDTVNLAAAETLGEVIELFNAAAPEVTASINTARNGIAIADSSGGAGNLIIANADATNSATKLGIAINQAVASVNSGGLQRQTLSEATLLSSLNGGKGVAIGDIQVTDANGVTRSADLNSVGNEARTVGDVISAINALTNGVEARINDAGDGVLVIDTTGGANALGVKDLSGDIAKTLNLTRVSTTITIEGTPTKVIDGAATHTIDLADLDVSSDAIPLSSLNDGSGVAAGDVQITDSAGRSLVLDLNGADAGIATIGQLIELINERAIARGVGVTASINSAGTGIRLENTAPGAGKLTVRDVNSTAAADLKIVGEAKIVGGVQVIDGAGAFTASSAAQTGLAALAAQINALSAGVTASTVFDGEGYRLSLASNATGSANELLIAAGDSTLSFEEVAKAQDSLLLYGNLSSPSGGVLISSATNQFQGAVGGVDLTVQAASETPVTVNVQSTDASLVDGVEDLVDAYNALRTDLDKLTAFDSEALTTGLLFGTNEALQIDSRLSRLLTDRFTGLGSFQSLEQIGLGVGNDGKLVLNKSRLKSAFTSNPAGVQEFLGNSQNGVAAKISAAVDKLAGAEESLLAARSDSLQATIAANQDRIDRFTIQLEKQQERLFLQFYQLEQVIAKLQQSQSALQNLQIIPPLTSVR